MGWGEQMRFSEVGWVFFDIGSTLVDERLAYEHRIRDMIAGSEVPYTQFYKKMIDCCCENQAGDVAAAAYFGLRRTPWHSEDEFLYDDATPALLKLCGRYHMGILANQAPGLSERLSAWGVRDFFDVVISSAEEGIDKSDPEIFRRALHRAGCSAEQAVMAGDRLDNDIAPAKALGMKTIWVRQGFSRFTHPICAQSTPDYTARNLTEVAQFLCAEYGVD